MSTLRDIPVALIDDGTNVRAKVDTGLVASVRRHGILQPIAVRAKGRRYEVVMGFRRLAAAREVGLARIPAVIEDAPAHDRVLRQLAENAHRRAMNPLDVARALQAHLEANPGLTKARLAAALGFSPRYGPVWVSNKLALLKLEGTLREKVERGDLSESQAIHARQRLNDGRGRPRSIPVPGAEEGRSRSVSVPIGRFLGGVGGTADIAIDRETAHVDLTLYLGDRGLFATLSPAEAKVLGRRLQQAGEALLAVAS